MAQRDAPPMVRPATVDEVDGLARLWYDGWHDAHARIVPAELTRLRTPQSFRERMAAALAHTRVAGPTGAPVGFCMLKGDELHQLYVAARARGTGVAAALLTDGEAVLARHGVTMAWLVCAIGNDRAARFYQKSGWRQAGTVAYTTEIPGGTYSLEVWRYEKQLAQSA